MDVVVTLYVFLIIVPSDPRCGSRILFTKEQKMPELKT